MFSHWRKTSRRKYSLFFLFSLIFLCQPVDRDIITFFLPDNQLKKSTRGSSIELHLSRKNTRFQVFPTLVLPYREEYWKKEKEKGKEKFAYRVSLREARFQTNDERFTLGNREEGRGRVCVRKLKPRHALQRRSDRDIIFDIGLKLCLKLLFPPSKGFRKGILILSYPLYLL